MIFVLFHEAEAIDLLVHSKSRVAHARRTAGQGMRRPMARRIAPGMNELSGERHQDAP
jgi:hypothetical protein